jgi:hypothetical protein
LLKIKNCKGGDFSFGGYPDPTTGGIPSPGYTMDNTFIDCIGGNISFAGNGSAYGTFINCTAGSGSFGNYCDGKFVDCISGDSSFATLGDIEVSSKDYILHKNNTDTRLEWSSFIYMGTDSEAKTYGFKVELTPSANMSLKARSILVIA